MLEKASKAVDTASELAENTVAKADAFSIATAVWLFGMLGMNSSRRAATNPRSLSTDARAQTGMANRAVNIIVAIVVAAILAAYLLPLAVTELAGVGTEEWPEGAAAMWDILPVIVILAIFLFFVGVAVNQRS